MPAKSTFEAPHRATLPLLRTQRPVSFEKAFLPLLHCSAACFWRVKVESLFFCSALDDDLMVLWKLLHGVIRCKMIIFVVIVIIVMVTTFFRSKIYCQGWYFSQPPPPPPPPPSFSSSKPPDHPEHHHHSTAAYHSGAKSTSKL
jgi:hypothetical protein